MSISTPDARKSLSLKLEPIVLLLLTAALLVYYFFKLAWPPLEIATFFLGTVLLWLPAAGLIFILLERGIHSAEIRLILSLIASYTLTTLLYFAVARVGLEPLFYIGQIAAFGWLIYVITIRKQWHILGKFLQRWQNWDWILITLLAASLVANLSYKTIYEDDAQTGAKVFVLYQDHLYHTGQAYALAEHIPPTQTYIRAGTPERAYHNFSHVTTMLIARFTGQSDMLRVHIVYHYTVIELLMSLAFYAIARVITSSKLGGYVAIALMYLLVFEWPPLYPPAFSIFYFTVFPHLSSGLDPVAFTSPQMYSGLVVCYGIFLGILCICKELHDGKIVTSSLLLVVAAMIAASLRFRLHVFIVILPAFLIICAFLWWRTHQLKYALTIIVTLLISALLYLEMGSSIYLARTSSLRIGYVGLQMFRTWGAFSSEVDHWLSSLSLPLPALTLLGDITALLLFVGLNVIGIPLLAATVAFLSNKDAVGKFWAFSLSACLAVVLSVVAAPLISTDSDSYSVGGQLLLHTRWYILPVAPVVVWKLYEYGSRHIRWPRTLSVTLGVLLVTGALIIRHVNSPSDAAKQQAANIVITQDEWEAVSFLHDHTPSDTVLLTNKVHDHFLLSGITGRAVYLEEPGNIVDNWAQQIYVSDDRLARINTLWATSSPAQFCEELRQIPAHYLIEYSDQPLLVREPDCLSNVWQGPNHQVMIWQIASKHGS